MSADLIARLEAATEPSTSLDDAISDFLGRPDAQFTSESRRYTSSIDAALTLVPADLPYWTVVRRDTPLGKMTSEAVLTNGELFMSGRRRAVDVWGHTPALALCIAALKARA